MTADEHAMYCKERIQMFIEMMKRCYSETKKK